MDVAPRPDPTCDTADFDREVEANFRWNFAVNTVDITFITLGLGIVSQATIMPLLVSELTSSRIAIGLIPAVYSLGFLLPQLFTANHAERLPRKKPFVVLVSALGERCPYLLLAIAIWQLAAPAPAVALVAFFLLIATSATSSGIANPAWYDMIAKVIPIHRRGLWSGVGRGLGAVLAVVGAAAAGRILKVWPFPGNFALCFALAFGSMIISWIGLALNREPVSPTVKPRNGMAAYFRQLPALLRQDRNYRRFLVSRSVANLGGMAAGFFMVYGKEAIPGTVARVGMFTAVLVATQAVTNPLWGIISDRKGHKLVLVSASFGMALSVGIARIAGSSLGLGIAFAILGIAVAADSMSRMNIILEFCLPEDRPTYIGLTSTLLAPAKALAPLLGGWLATLAGYRAMFAVALIIAALGAVLLWQWVREPRAVGRTPDSHR